MTQYTDYKCFSRFCEYDHHTSIYVYKCDEYDEDKDYYREKELYNIDISPYHYEKGGGYNWKKIKDVEFSSNMVSITPLYRDVDDFIDNDCEPIGIE